MLTAKRVVASTETLFQAATFVTLVLYVLVVRRAFFISQIRTSSVGADIVSEERFENKQNTGRLI